MWKEYICYLSLQQAQLVLLMEEELVGVWRYNSTRLITALIHTGGLGKPGRGHRVCCCIGVWEGGWGSARERRSRRADKCAGRRVVVGGEGSRDIRVEGSWVAGGVWR